MLIDCDCPFLFVPFSAIRLKSAYLAIQVIPGNFNSFCFAGMQIRCKMEYKRKVSISHGMGTQGKTARHASWSGSLRMKEDNPMNELKMKILELLKEDARRNAELLSTMLDVSLEQIQSAIEEMEEDKVIVKYATVINWSKVDEDKVTALIEVQITPERGRGFDAIAERIYLYPEVKTVYLMSGAYDLLVEIEGRTLKEAATFVSTKLSTLESVLSTKTHFILKKYKQDGVIFEEHEGDHRMLISP